jgi:Tfp pilus assembly protein PilO
MFQKKQKNNSRVSRVSTKSRSTNFSYYGNKGINNDEIRPRGEVREESNSTVKQANRLLSLLIFMALISVAGYILFLNDKVNVIVNKNSAKSSLKSTSIYEAAAQSYLNNSLANNTKITANSTGLEKYMESTFPELNNVLVTIPFLGHTLSLSISQASPVAIVNSYNSQSFLIKSNGVIMANTEGSNISDLATKIPYVIDSFSVVKINQQALSVSDLSFINYVFSELDAKSIKTVSYTLVPNSRELDVKTVLNTYTIKFNLQNDSKEQVGNYLALKKYLEKNNINPGQYIDVRVTGRAYYK